MTAPDFLVLARHWKNKSGPNGRFGRVYFSRQGSRGGAGDVSGVCGSLQGVSSLVASCPGTGSTVFPWWRGDSLPPSSTEKLFRNVQRAAGPSPLAVAFVTAPCILCPVPTGWHAVPRAQGPFLFPSAARRAGRQQMTLWGQVESSLKRPGNPCAVYRVLCCGLISATPGKSWHISPSHWPRGV